MDPIRSILYLPAHKDEWVADATSNDADGLILDLEDSVPVSRRAAARKTLKKNKSALSAADTTVTLRVNEVGTDSFYEDIDLVGSWVDAVVLPKTESAADVRTVASILAYIEHRAAIEETIEILPLLESPLGICSVGEIVSASTRVTAIGSSTSNGGDIQQSLGLGWSETGEETIHVRSKIVLEARAAGVDQLFSGVWAALDDTEGLREKATRQKRFGFTGMQVVHPGQIEVVNDVFTPSDDELEYYRELIDAYERETERGQGAIRFDGQMIDAAMVKQARRIVERASEGERE